ncbi:HNH endonuclease signature motif containing protein [Rhodococcus sp. ARC_M5]|uniref:HNH endonuclease signature motif containing protein n=1 Tax=Rhodococcus sp. ARC_M5 TaxID=2928851 RepID=UPI001FB50696|nr:HNH endonuclease signature motif containing protein [Rhodococcus sp. ARC_M5]MCJ0893554.1 HNH endonuclease [Rhodococcus sp. ARC_M5]
MLSGDGGSGVDGIETVPPAPEVSDPELSVLVDAVESAVAELAEQASVSWTNADRRAVIQRMETLTRSVTAYSHTWLNELIAQHGLDVYPGSVPCSVAWMLRITPRTAGARVRLAAELGDRTALSGEVLPPLLPHTADALRAGLLDAQHVQMIREFFKHLPASVDPQTRDLAEQQLVGFASTRRPDDFAPLVANLDSILNPDGDHDEDEDEDGKPKPRKRRDAFFYLGEQGTDGMSEGKFCVDPELRAYLEALFSKAAKPGVNNPADPTSVVHDETSSDETSSGSDEKGGSRSRGNGSGTAPKPEPSDASSSDAGLWHSNNCGSDGDCGDSECDCDDNCCDEGNCGDEGNCRDCGCGTEPDRSDDTAATDTDTDTDTDDAPDRTAPGSDEPDTAVPDTAVPDTAARDAAAARDVRTQNERCHDALKLALRHTLASGTLGTHRGLPVTAIVTMTLKDLEAGCGYAKTATGSRVSIRDAIRMASHAHHYLTIFDDHGRALYLGRSKRIASADQRIVLIARDRGCSFPSCTRPATWCQAHHVTDWVDGGFTDIDGLTFGCDMHHALVGTGPNTWATTKTTATHRYPGRTLWHPPTGMDPRRRGLINHAHHPEEVLYPPDHHDDPGDEEPRQPA